MALKIASSTLSYKSGLDDSLNIIVPELSVASSSSLCVIPANQTIGSKFKVHIVLDPGAMVKLVKVLSNTSPESKMNVIGNVDPSECVCSLPALLYEYTAGREQHEGMS